MKASESVAFQKEVLRYLGCQGAQTGERIISQITFVAEEVASDINAKNVFGIWDCRVEADTVTLDRVNIKSSDLACHLRNCSKAVLLAATLGTGADTLLRRYNALDMEKALIAQAVCTVMIEQYCDTVVSEIAHNSCLDGLYPTARFSPGYGDFDIKWQKDMLKLLNAEKSIAISLTDGLMLIPSKSVTAVVGFSKEKHDNHEKKCAHCTNTCCKYRNVM
jgi:cobalamin-dependent methionine synthase I